MNQQREAIYAERRRVLESEEMPEHAWGLVEDAVQGVFVASCPEGAEVEPHAVSVRLKSLFWPGIEKPLQGVDTREALETAREKILEDLRGKFDEKRSSLGEETASMLARFVVLHVLDSQWKEHLLAMDDLRRGIGLRAIGQKDPLLEYQFESYNLFQEMLARVREGVAELLYRVAVVSEERRSEASRDLRESRDMPLPFLQSPGQEDAQHHALGEGRKRQPIRKTQRVGRNDPCPCGSGKKYKHCCGRNL